jgi:hypothetical protein
MERAFLLDEVVGVRRLVHRNGEGSQTLEW